MEKISDSSLEKVIGGSDLLDGDLFSAELSDTCKECKKKFQLKDLNALGYCPDCEKNRRKKKGIFA